jgi:hypothetical protein
LAAGANREHALQFEQAQRFPHGLPASVVPPHHLAFQRESITDFQQIVTDRPNDAMGDDRGCFGAKFAPPSGGVAAPRSVIGWPVAH